MHFNINLNITCDGVSLARSSFSPTSQQLSLSFKALDIPAQGADRFCASLCSDAEFIKVVKMDRKKLAKHISNIMTKNIIDALSSNDTIMGYKVETN